MKESINSEFYCEQVMKKISKGILLTSKSGFKVNSMAIAWGSIGRVWNKQVFIAYIKESRYTKELVDDSSEFTINIPIDQLDSNILNVCGSKTGRDFDKISMLDFTLIESNKINTPGILEVPITLECKVIYKQKLNPKEISEIDLERFYSKNISVNENYHTVYYGEIVDAYILKK